MILEYHSSHSFYFYFCCLLILFSFAFFYRFYFALTMSHNITSIMTAICLKGEKEKERGREIRGEKNSNYECLFF